MISISLEWLVFICLFIFIAGIFSVWTGYEVIRRYRARQAVRKRLRCRLCCMEFEDSSSLPLATCPQCGSLNERIQSVVF